VRARAIIKRRFFHLSVVNSRDVAQSLLSERPKFHGAAGECDWSLRPSVLWWLYDILKPTDVTLETGSGYSTIIFALKGTRHTVISPRAHEHTLIRDWSAAHNVDLSKVTFLAERSESALPMFNGGKLDLVLIDGSHAFPAPIIDWLYTSRWLATGGRVVVDDTQIRSCRILCDFLRAEQGRWNFERRITYTDIFQRLDAPLLDVGWEDQPWQSKPILD
jgi:hypothetical protein